MDTDNARLKAILVFAATLAFVLSPLYVRGFNGFDPNAFPIPQENPPVQPAGYAFSIWGLIYLWLLVHAAYGLFKRADDPVWDAPRWPLFGSMAIGASWLAVANISPVWASVQIVVMLVLAVMALLRTTPDHERWLLTAPLALYAGWLTAASWVSVGLILGGYGITGPELAAIVALLGAAATAQFVQRAAPHAFEYSATVIWALIAVVVANVGTAPLPAFLAGALTLPLLLMMYRARPRA